MGCEVWADRWVEGEGKGGVKGLSSRTESVTKQVGSIGFEFARVGEHEDKGRV